MQSLLTPADATQAIKNLDEVALKLLRESWLDATTDQKSKWMERINRALDERLILMRIRDGQPAT